MNAVTVPADKLAELQREAARYRWLRSFDAVGELLGFPWTCGDGTRYLDEYRDADIDDAMARAPGVRDTDGGGHG
jgi:hypothetical protein